MLGRRLAASSRAALGHVHGPTRLNSRLMLQRRLLATSETVTATPTPLSPPPAPKRKSTLSRALWLLKGAAWVGISTGVGILVVGGSIFLHDAFTYNTRHVDRVPVSPMALHPEVGGPKQLPIARVMVDDEDTDANKELAHKPRLVIVGAGWGAMSLLKTLRPNDYHVTLISPTTTTLFTPLLPSAAVGTVSLRALMESIRKLLARVHGHYIMGTAVDVAFNDRLLEITTPGPDGQTRNIYVPYDKLVIACGSVSATHGVPGLENCYQLKTIEDARNIRRRILSNFETASLPTTTAEERKRLLSFVICGGGPTGVETAAEIYDLCQEDIINYFPKLVREEVSISVIQSRDHILNTYSEAISKYAEKKFSKDEVNVITNARVGAVKPDCVIYTTKDPATGKVTEHIIPANFVLWSTGISKNPFSERVTSLVPNQVHKKAIETDAHLRVKGAPLGSVYAIGDCSTIETSVLSHLLDFVAEADKNNDGMIDFEEWQIMAARIKKKIPMSSGHLLEIRELFEQYDTNKDMSLGLNELASLLQDLERKITSLPATAQVASQQGKYLGTKFSKLIRNAPSADVEDPDDAVADTFSYRHLGSLAYIGNAAVFDLGNWSFMGGLAAMYAWRSVYWSEGVSARTRALLMMDWIIRGIWGRDLSN
ncbi:nucleotide-binding domain-containing protein [Exidia glandulosa HHB12029]|uniref:Nucleotide-binding domain-containing protein n=1 Tax=Exidia glandulosa HHB12029 TaxID=1314781 RepID=A0A165I4M9_EXIGL|nr:nucleotide-binding domain-containing protein [Exidia glandulosa HHB12029]